jgi:16S rRNA (adenine1518-N6/adenine1519-N6)-dimethyltransferase
MFNRSQLKELFLKYDFSPLKRFGENYLIDRNVKDAVITEARPAEGDIILEIGPGLGALTADLAGSGADVWAVEKDAKAFAMLEDICGGKYPRLRLFNEDILKFDLARLRARKKIKVVGSLPYYATTPIIEYLIGNKNRISSAIIVVQKEFADRLLASAGSKDYASISCFIRYHTDPSYVRTIAARSFFPEPKVDSGLVRLDFLASPAVAVRDEQLFFRIVRGAFNQRRKTVMNSLSRAEVLDVAKDELSKVLAAARVDPSARPETLSLADFANIANAIK